MARKPRITVRGVTHHVYSRCIEERTLLLKSFAPDLLVEVLNLAQKKYEFELVCYQIMDNHFHFIIRTLLKGESISRIMQYIKARFAERYNMKMGRIGPFWNERFKDTIIETVEKPESYFLWLLWYLAFNPVRKGIKKDPRTFKYGSINCYLDENYKSLVRVTLHSYFMELGRNFRERAESFLWYEKAYLNRWAIPFQV
jgi:putative transposase